MSTATARKYNDDPIQTMLNGVEKAYDEITVKHRNTCDTYITKFLIWFKNIQKMVFADFVPH